MELHRSLKSGSSAILGVMMANRLQKRNVNLDRKIGHVNNALFITRGGVGVGVESHTTII